MQSITTDMARRQLSQLLEQVYYTNAQFQIKRNRRPMACLVSAPYMEKLNQLVDQSPGLAETLAIQLDDDLMAAIRQGKEDIKTGNTESLTALLEGEDAL